MTVVGYARVSKREQNPNAQKAELHAAGAERVFVDHGDSSRVKDRPQWLACMDYLRAGDVLYVPPLTFHHVSSAPNNVRGRTATCCCCCCCCCCYYC